MLRSIFVNTIVLSLCCNYTIIQSYMYLIYIQMTEQRFQSPKTVDWLISRDISHRSCTQISINLRSIACVAIVSGATEIATSLRDVQVCHTLSTYQVSHLQFHGYTEVKNGTVEPSPLNYPIYVDVQKCCPLSYRIAHYQIDAIFG